MRVEDVLQRIQGEFVEMPGLCLTAAQAQRLWGLDLEFLRTSCSKTLVDASSSCRDGTGLFIRVDSGADAVRPQCGVTKDRSRHQRLELTPPEPIG